MDSGSARPPSPRKEDVVADSTGVAARELDIIVCQYTSGDINVGSKQPSNAEDTKLSLSSPHHRVRLKNESCYGARVHRSWRAHRFVRLRQHRLSKLLALWFILLILLPFTAPFPTYQFGSPSSSHPYDAIPKDAKDKAGFDEDLALPSAWSLVPPALTGRVGGHLGRSNQLDRHSPHHTVLRL